MRTEREDAIKLRKEGKSYREIRDELKIPLSTISEWFKNEEWSKELSKKLASAMQGNHTARLVELNQIRGRHLDRLYKEAKEEAKEELQKLKYHPLFIAGLMLYWGEGDKSSNRSGVKLTNTDPLLVQLYVRFLTHACKIPISKIRGHVLVYPDLDEPSCRRFWSGASGIPIGQFTKSTRIAGRHETRRLSWGVCMVTVSSTYFKEKMRVWLKELPILLMERAYYENIR